MSQHKMDGCEDQKMAKNTDCDVCEDFGEVARKPSWLFFFFSSETGEARDQMSVNPRLEPSLLLSRSGQRRAIKLVYRTGH